MQTLELFAGCGGLAKGLERAGFKHAGLLEINHQACESLRANFNPRLVHEADVKKVDFRAFAAVDVVSGGPPCQPFSLGGIQHLIVLPFIGNPHHLAFPHFFLSFSGFP